MILDCKRVLIYSNRGTCLTWWMTCELKAIRLGGGVTGGRIRLFTRDLPFPSSFLNLISRFVFLLLLLFFLLPFVSSPVPRNTYSPVFHRNFTAFIYITLLKKSNSCFYFKTSIIYLRICSGFSNEAESWLHKYEDPDFVDDVDSLWESIRPIYMQVHAYVRRRLVEVYGSDIVDPHGPIPAHLLGKTKIMICWKTIHVSIPKGLGLGTNVRPYSW